MAIVATDICEIGYAYPAVYTSPVFTGATLAALKRVRYISVWFDNDLERYVVGDENSASSQSPADLANTYKLAKKVNIAISYGNSQDAETSTDVYSYDFTPESDAWNNFREALQGVSAAFQLIVWSIDDGAWTMSGYQIDDKIVGRRHTSGD
jgi:hypothetical protein